MKKEQIATGQVSAGRHSRAGSFSRRPLSLWAALAALLVCIGGEGCGKDPKTGAAAQSETAPLEQSLLDLEGRGVNPLETPEAKVSVFFFVSTDCPISNRYAPEYRRLHERLASRGVQFWLVYPNADETAEAIRRHLKEFALPLPALRDPRHALAKHAKAKVTPEAAVFDAHGQMVYHGRIDDRFPSLGKERPAPTSHELNDVLEAMLEGKPVPVSTAPAIGCRISN